MPKTAEERGAELFHSKPVDIPPLAREFMEKLCAEMGACGEVMLSALTAYAQCVEGLTCSDNLYLARSEDKAWFMAKQGEMVITSEEAATILRTVNNTGAIGAHAMTVFKRLQTIAPDVKVWWK